MPDGRVSTYSLDAAAALCRLELDILRSFAMGRMSGVVDPPKCLGLFWLRGMGSDFRPVVAFEGVTRFGTTKYEAVTIDQGMRPIQPRWMLRSGPLNRISWDRWAGARTGPAGALNGDEPESAPLPPTPAPMLDAAVGP